jgi:hypothetical protein
MYLLVAFGNPFVIKLPAFRKICKNKKCLNRSSVKFKKNLGNYEVKNVKP